MLIIYNKYIPPKGFSVINLFNVFLVRKEFEPISLKRINHEKIHTRQGREMLWALFYLWYGIEWTVNIIRYKGNTGKAYRNISFEREAYANHRDMGYLKNRKYYSWTKYIRRNDTGIIK